MSSDYGTMLLNAIEETDRDASEVRLVMSFGCKLTKDGDRWCCLLGENLQVGHGEFASSPMGAIEKMRAYMYNGEEKSNEPK